MSEETYFNEPDRDDYQYPSADDIRRSIGTWGLTPAEQANELYAARVLANQSETEYVGGHRVMEDERLLWAENRERDILTNFLYGEWLQAFLLEGMEVTFQEFSEFVGCKALIRLMTRTRGSHALLDALFPDDPEHKPSIEDVQVFLLLDRHRTKDPLEFVARVYTEIPQSGFAVQRLNERYSQIVRDAWDKHRMRAESPLPVEPDWMFGDRELNNREKAVEAVIAGMPVNEAAGRYGVSNKTVKKDLAEQGIVLARGRKKQNV
jgi:hypothetical protein